MLDFPNRRAGLGWFVGPHLAELLAVKDAAEGPRDELSGVSGRGIHGLKRRMIRGAPEGEGGGSMIAFEASL